MTEPQEPVPDAGPTQAPSPSPSTAHTAAAAAALVAMAPRLRYALASLGVLASLEALLGVERSPLLALTRLVAWALAAWIVPVLLRAVADGLESSRARVSAVDRLAEAVARLSEVPGRGAVPEAPSGGGSPGPLPAVGEDARLSTLAEIRVAIREARWPQAEALIRAFADAHPDDVAASRVAAELASARQEAVEGLHARIEAAREANEPGQVFEAHGELTLLLTARDRRELDRTLARWMMAQVQKRLRNGLISLDAVTLATRVTEAFGETPEAASLRAALPTLRRSAGLCARCGRPYRGLDDACPACLAAAHAPAPPRPDEEGGLPDLAEGDEIDPELF